MDKTSPSSLKHHLFTAAVCLGTVPIKNPNNPLSQYCLMQLDQATATYASLRLRIKTDPIAQNHQWLLRLQARAQAQVQSKSSHSTGLPPPSAMERSPADEQIDDASLLGWRTRLVQCAGRSGQTIETAGAQSAVLDLPSSAAYPSLLPGALPLPATLSAADLTSFDFDRSPHSERYESTGDLVSHGDIVAWPVIHLLAAETLG